MSGLPDTTTLNATRKKPNPVRAANVAVDVDVVVDAVDVVADRVPKNPVSQLAKKFVLLQARDVRSAMRTTWMTVTMMRT